MKKLNFLLALAMIAMAVACNRPSAEQEAPPESTEETAKATNATEEVKARDQRDPQTIDKFLSRMDEATNLTDEQAQSIRSLLTDGGYEGLTRAEQREFRKNFIAKITTGILTPEQTEAWNSRRDDKEDGGGR